MFGGRVGMLIHHNFAEISDIDKLKSAIKFGGAENDC